MVMPLSKMAFFLGIRIAVITRTLLTRVEYIRKRSSAVEDQNANNIILLRR